MDVGEVYWIYGDYIMMVLETLPLMRTHKWVWLLAPDHAVENVVIDSGEMSYTTWTMDRSDVVRIV